MNYKTLMISFLFMTSATFTVAKQNNSAPKSNQALSEINEQNNKKEIEWKRWTPAVFEQAKKDNKLLLVDFAAEWCSFCKKMDKTTWLDSEVQGSIADYYIPVRVDDEIDPVIAEKYRDYGRPAIVVLNGDSIEIAKKTGYLEPLYMHWMLEGVAQNPTAEANAQ